MQEELSSNFFLQTITLRFPNVYAALLQNDWILCVPMSVSQSALATDRNFRITEDFIGTELAPNRGRQAAHITSPN